MKNRLMIVSLISILSFSSCEVSWYDVRNDIWESEPVYVSTSQLDFNETVNSIDFHISNKGNYNEVSFRIIAEQDWITIFPNSGTVSKGQDIIINADLNRSLLEEGTNTGNIYVDIEGKNYKIEVSAIGMAELGINPDYVDFGASSSSKTVSVFSKTGNKRMFIFTPLNDWIEVDVDRCLLVENTGGSEDKVKPITISCNRSILRVGTHEGVIQIKSEKETYKSEYKVIVTIPEQSGQSLQIGDLIFSISKAPYRKPNGTVSIELIIENASSLYRNFSLEYSSSRAIASDNSTYHVSSDPVNVNKKSKEMMLLNISGVPESITSFKSVELDFSLSELVIFSDLSF